MRFEKRIIGSFAALAAAFGAGIARAQDEVLSPLPILGAPKPGGIALQDKYTEIGHDMAFLDATLLVIIGAISLFVTALIGWCIYRYNAKSNPVAKRFTHNTPVELAWTLVPVLILAVIGSLSLPILMKQLEIPEADVTIKVTGYQWYWGYEYPDHGIAFDSFMIGAGAGNKLTPEVVEELEAAGYSESEFLLATDTAMVVPVGATVKMQVTGGDVIHSWKIPSFGVHMDGIPGRLNETWFAAEEPGIYFGQCSELCGIAHAYMPITVKVVPQDEYEAWIEAATERYADADLPGAVDVAAAE